MKIICAGFAKTGTKSIAKALRYLGFTVFDWEEQMFDFRDHWFDVFQNGAKPDVKRVYQNADVYGVPSPPKIKADHNIQLDSLTINLANINIIFHSSTLYFVSQSLKL